VGEAKLGGVAMRGKWERGKEKKGSDQRGEVRIVPRGKVKLRNAGRGRTGLEEVVVVA